MIVGLDLFCGGGGFSYGIELSGIHIKYAIDHFKGVKETFEYNHPNTEFVLSDIQDLDPEDFKDVDLIIGSPPCKEFSKANTKKDIKKGMELVFVFLKWVKIIKPKSWIMENVIGIEEHLHRYKEKYHIRKIKNLNALDYGIPQKRKRTFSGNYRIPRITHIENGGIKNMLGETIRSYISVRKALCDIIDKVEYKPPRDYQLKEDFYYTHKPIDLDKPSIVLTTKDDFALMPYREDQLRRITPQECARLQSFPDTFKFIGSDTNKFILIGNAVAPLMAFHLGYALQNKSYRIDTINKIIKDKFDLPYV